MILLYSKRDSCIYGYLYMIRRSAATEWLLHCPLFYCADSQLLLLATLLVPTLSRSTSSDVFVSAFGLARQAGNGDDGPIII